MSNMRKNKLFKISICIFRNKNINQMCLFSVVPSTIVYFTSMDIKMKLQLTFHSLLTVSLVTFLIHFAFVFMSR